MITSFIPGRIRFRSPIFQDSDIYSAVFPIIKNLREITSFSYNQKTGSLLVQYDPEKIPVEKLKPLMPLAERMKPILLFYSDRDKPVVLKAVGEVRNFLEQQSLLK